jgi:hypothetical protein
VFCCFEEIFQAFDLFQQRFRSFVPLIGRALLGEHHVWFCGVHGITRITECMAFIANFAFVNLLQALYTNQTFRAHPYIQLAMLRTFRGPETERRRLDRTKVAKQSGEFRFTRLLIQPLRLHLYYPCVEMYMLKARCALLYTLL